MKTLKITLEKDAKQFLLRLVPSVLELFDVPQTILGFDVHNVVQQKIYSMSEESAKQKLNRLKELLDKW